MVGLLLLEVCNLAQKECNVLNMHLLFPGTAKVSRFYRFVQIQNIKTGRFEIKTMKMNLTRKQHQLTILADIK